MNTNVPICSTAENNGLYEDEEVYDIFPVKELKDLLEDGCSLCIAFGGYFPHGLELGIIQLLRGTWIKTDGSSEETAMYVAKVPEIHQSAPKDELSRIYRGKYLFSSWKKSCMRTFKICIGSKVLAVYYDFESAISALIPGQFLPRGIYIRKLNWMGVLGLTVTRARKRKELRRILCKILRMKRCIKLNNPMFSDSIC